MGIPQGMPFRYVSMSLFVVWFFFKEPLSPIYVRMFIFRF
jgi:hypothetical protein